MLNFLIILCGIGAVACFVAALWVRGKADNDGRVDMWV